jgi:hypothetical protein
MRRKPLAQVSRKKRELPGIPKSHYAVFRELLIELLEQDGSYKAHYLRDQFESKLSDAPGGASDDVRRQRAIAKWLATEERNRDTNIRIMLADDEDFLFLDSQGFPVSARDVIDWCRDELARFFKGSNSDDLRGSFSGGASTSLRRGVGQIPRKYQIGKDITSSAVRHYIPLSDSLIGMPRDLTLVKGNVLFTVPKTSEIDRCACKEPDLNMYCQKAVGNEIRRRLKKHGIDLNDQSVNQEWSQLGSLTGEYATVDLSSASDSVTKQIVIEMLPFEWSSLLLDLRSPITLIDGVEHVNEMISSMGNAYTFELESLLFWVMARCCAYFTRTPGRISVYGDDIICPTGLKDSMGAVLEFFGFKQNPTKSFWDGGFRESCGTHWFDGREVTPFYVKETPKTVSDWCLLLNHLRTWSYDDGIAMCDPRYYDLWVLFSELVPRPLQGGNDTASRANLAVPGLRRLASIRRKKRTVADVEEEFQLGAYMQWLDTASCRPREQTPQSVSTFCREDAELLRITPPPVDVHLVTNTFAVEATDMLGRPINDYWNVGIPTFPQEVGVGVGA